MITSASNQNIKFIRRLLQDRRFRRQEQLFVVEGSRWLAELVDFDIIPALVLATASYQQGTGNAGLLDKLGVTARIVSDEVMSQVSDTVTPAGVLAVIPMFARPWPDRPTLLLILDRIGNPGNLGTMMRTAGAAGVDGLILAPGCVDAYNPKVVRGGMGAHLRLPIREMGWPEIRQLTAGLALWLAAAGAAVTYTEPDWLLPSALILGSEAAGASDEAATLAANRLSIPMLGDTESLNAAVAAAVILFEAARQRRQPGKERPSPG